MERDTLTEKPPKKKGHVPCSRLPGPVRAGFDTRPLCILQRLFLVILILCSAPVLHSETDDEKISPEVVKEYRKLAGMGIPEGEYYLGICYQTGNGVEKDLSEAVMWIQKAAGQNYAPAQYKLGIFHMGGLGIPKDPVEAVKWYRKAAGQGNAMGQFALGICYFENLGVSKNAFEAYKWLLQAEAQDEEDIGEALRSYIATVEKSLSRKQLEEAQKEVRQFTSRVSPDGSTNVRDTKKAAKDAKYCGTGFFFTNNGYFITNHHVVKNAGHIRLDTDSGMFDARLVKIDATNDLALLKVGGTFPALPVTSSDGVKLGATVTTIGFPNITLQGFAPKLAKGEIAALSGLADDIRYFQISVPVQPGNSGGALVDDKGNVVGIVSAKLDASTALDESGALPENVNYAVKSSVLLSFLDSVPSLTGKLEPPFSRYRKFEDVVESTKRASVLVMVY